MTRVLSFCEVCNVAAPFCRCPKHKINDGPWQHSTVKPTPPGGRKKPSRADKAHAKDIPPSELLERERVVFSASRLKTLTLPGHTEPFFSETVLSRVLGRSDAKAVLAAVDALLTAVGEPRCP